MSITTLHERPKPATENLPGVSLALAAVACFLMAFPALADWLQYDRAAVAAGQLWRIVTCHLTHWSPDHLFWDVVALLLLGCVVERDGYRRLLTCIGLSALSIPLAVHIGMPELSTYRGLSGIDSAVFMLLAVTLIVDAWRQGDRGWTLLCTALIVGFVAKTGFEFLTGTTLFVDAAAADMQPVPLAHVVGAGIGTLCAVPWKRR